MRRRAAVIVLIALASLAPAAAESAAGTFTFYGSGFGHGLGMSQWGAYGLAQGGWTHEQILEHYYTGTDVVHASGESRSIRVGLTQGRTRIHLEARGGPVEIHVGGASGPLVGAIPGGDTWTVDSNAKQYRVRDARGDIVGGRLWGGEPDPLVAYFSEGSRAYVPEAGHSYGRGRLELGLYNCAGCSLRLVGVIPIEQYLYGIAEVNSSWPAEALRAQADAARTYALRKAEVGQHRPGCDCAVYATSADQVYAGWDKEHEWQGDRWVGAVDATAGEVIEYQGALIQAFYMASSGGHTENNENVWGGAPIPYLRGVCDPGDYVPANSTRAWSVSLSDSSVTSRLAPYTGNIGTVTGFVRDERGVSGRVVSVTVRGTSGEDAITGSQLKAGLGLRDTRVWFDEDRNLTGPIRAEYDRLSCAPGLPKGPEGELLGGSRVRFDDGAIYHNVARELTVWLNGPVYDDYLGSKDALGLPKSKMVAITKPPGCGGGGCVRTKFEGGAIYLRDGLGAHALRGPVLDRYLSMHGPSGVLGFPTADVRKSAGTWRGSFEHGTITCTGPGSCEVA